MEKFPESLEPNSEQQLFEKLALEKDDLEALDFIRRQMKVIYKQEQRNAEENSGSK